MNQQDMVKLMKKQECLKKNIVKHINKLVKKETLHNGKIDIRTLLKYVNQEM